jgi:metal-responsive CopG/Arc/MetJ family transcriptional regulator
MRTVIDIPDDQVDALDRFAAEAGKSRAALIREALQNLISRREPERSLNEYFGLWGPSKEDGLAFQERMRAEWSA